MPTTQTQQLAPATPTVPLAELGLSPLAAAVAASPQWAAYLKTLPPQPERTPGSHPLLDALAAFLASPAGQALEAALINMLIQMLPKP